MTITKREKDRNRKTIRTETRNKKKPAKTVTATTSSALDLYQ